MVQENNVSCYDEYTDLSRTLSERGDPYEILEKELGLGIRQYRYQWEMISRDFLDSPYPLHLNFELVYGCNLRCEFCIFSLPREEWNYNAKPGDKIPFDKYCQIIDEGLKHGLCSVALNGYNEPLLQSDITKYINYARQAGILDISLHTNGILLSEQMSKELINSGLTTIMFSIDAATDKTYQKIRQSHDFHKVKKNIIHFLELKKHSGKALPLTRVSFVENRINHTQLQDFISFWRGKVDFFTIQSFCNSFVGKDIYESIEEKYRLKDTPFGKCPEPYRRLTILCNGDILPCCSNYGLGLVIGNIYYDSIYSLWNSSKIKELRLKINSLNNEQPQACKECRLSFVANSK